MSTKHAPPISLILTDPAPWRLRMVFDNIARHAERALVAIESGEAESARHELISIQRDSIIARDAIRETALGEDYHEHTRPMGKHSR